MSRFALLTATTLASCLILLGSAGSAFAATPTAGSVFRPTPTAISIESEPNCGPGGCDGGECAGYKRYVEEGRAQAALEQTHFREAECIGQEPWTCNHPDCNASHGGY